MNNFLNFYGQNEISPVSQNISDMKIHFGRRTALYRTLGLAESLFDGKSVLEVAPGSGYNSIVTATFKPRIYDLVEPNPSGYRKMVSLFTEHQLQSNSIRMFNSRLEDFQGELKYDIVICEGLIPGLSGQDDFLTLLIDRVRVGGILVLTCADAVSVFFESLRRYLAKLLVRDLIESPNKLDWQKLAVSRLLPIFQPHLNTLQGMSRPPEDWIWDNLLNPAATNLAASNEFSIEKCLSSLGGSFYFYGSSPVFMEDWQWYKNLPLKPSEYNAAYVNSYSAKRHNFLHWQECSHVSEVTDESLQNLCKDFSMLLEQRDSDAWRRISQADIQYDLERVRQVEEISRRYGLQKSAQSLREFIALFENDQIPDGRAVAEMRDFCGAFGRGQQYLSLIKA